MLIVANDSHYYEEWLASTHRLADDVQTNYIFHLNKKHKTMNVHENGMGFKNQVGVSQSVHLGKWGCPTLENVASL